MIYETDMKAYPQYLRPLSPAADEADAVEMAAVVYSTIVSEHEESGKCTLECTGQCTFNDDQVYLQCLVDARRMIRDRAYWVLIYGDDTDFPQPRH
jgi:hypothetical protein